MIDMKGNGFFRMERLPGERCRACDKEIPIGQADVWRRLVFFADIGVYCDDCYHADLWVKALRRRGETCCRCGCEIGRQITVWFLKQPTEGSGVYCNACHWLETAVVRNREPGTGSVATVESPPWE